MPPDPPAAGAGEGRGPSSDLRSARIVPIPLALSGRRSGDRGTLTLGLAPRRRSPSSARQPAGSSSGSSSSGGSSGRSPGGGGGGDGWARAMAGAGSGSRARPRRAAPAGLRTPRGGSTRRARRKACARSQEILARRGCNAGGWLRDRGGAPSGRCWQVGPAGIWTDRSRRIPGARELRARGLGEGGPEREGASGRSSGCTVIRRSAAGPTLIPGSGCARRPGSEEGSCCAAHVLTSAVPSAGATALGERGGTGSLPVNAAAPPLATGRPLTDLQERWFSPQSTLREFSWRRLYQAHPRGLRGLEWVGRRKR